jgi:polysaccharide pyruvyl transferase WcaK-like protein
MNRRHLLGNTLIAAIAASTGLSAEPHRAPRILLRSSWQVVNIGDIAHTPGVLALIERYIPGAEVILWSSGDITPEVIEMERRRFPQLKFVKGSIDPDGTTKVKRLDEAIDWCDFLLHGSGPSLVAYRDVAAFVRRTGKPFGVYGITYGGGSAEQQALMSRAQFLYFRDTVSLAKAKTDGIDCPIMEFGPDGAFAVDLRDDARATAYLDANGLEEGKFLCCLARYRYTPYWLVKKGRAKDAERDARNQAMREHDIGPLRDAIIAVVRKTDHKVLLCPEDMTQMTITKEDIYDRLPDDVRQRVVWREKFWLTDEALSTYCRSSGIFGLEMHSPIMCIGNGIPAIVCRFEEQTSKGFMWRDIGLDDWLFDMDKPDEVARLTPTVLSLVDDPQTAQAKVAQAVKVVEERQRITMGMLRRSLQERLTVVPAEFNRKP